MKRTSVVEHNLYFARARDHGINKRSKQIINNYDIHNTIINNCDIQNTIPNNEIIPNLNKLKISASTNYWHILNKNADKIHKNISASKMHKKNRRISKIQADFQNSGVFPKYRRLQKIRRPYCLGSAESPAADFLLVWLKSSHSDLRRCDVPLMQSQSKRWTACMLLLFARSLSYCTGCLYRPTCQNSRGNTKTRRKSKIVKPTE
jgi:hypothetical protein